MKTQFVGNTKFEIRNLNQTNPIIIVLDAKDLSKGPICRLTCDRIIPYGIKQLRVKSLY